jgi:hypothetical protein
MSKRRGIWASLPLAALDWCKKAAGRYWRFAGGIVWSITDGRRADEFEVSLPKNPVQVDFCGERIELREFSGALHLRGASPACHPERLKVAALKVGALAIPKHR